MVIAQVLIWKIRRPRGRLGFVAPLQGRASPWNRRKAGSRDLSEDYLVLPHEIVPGLDEEPR